MISGNRLVHYLMGLQKLGATATITGDHVEEHTNLSLNDDEMRPPGRPSRLDIVLDDIELSNAKKLVPHLSVIEKRDFWGSCFQGRSQQIPEDAVRLTESEMGKVVAALDAAEVGVVEAHARYATSGPSEITTSCGSTSCRRGRTSRSRVRNGHSGAP